MWFGMVAASNYCQMTTLLRGRAGCPDKSVAPTYIMHLIQVAALYLADIFLSEHLT